MGPLCRGVPLVGPWAHCVEVCRRWAPWDALPPLHTPPPAPSPTHPSNDLSTIQPHPPCSTARHFLRTLMCAQNSKLLNAIDSTRSAYQTTELARSAAEHAQHSRWVRARRAC